MKSPPFRGAHLKDPFFRRLSAPDKKAFWKIFSSLELSDSARDLFERMVDRDPKTRFNIADVLDHAWLKSGEILPDSELIKEFGFRDEILQKLAAEE
jgi:serine/threonine protein kinase